MRTLYHWPLLCCFSVTVAVAQNVPQVRVHIPPNVSAKTLRITYFMLGPFGGYGDSVTKQGEHESVIQATAKGKSASSIKLISYAPGCDFQEDDFNFEDYPEVDLHFVCAKLRTTALRGHISGFKLPPVSRAKLEVRYLADWSMDFFGYKDGSPAEFLITSVHPDQHGGFEVELPDFTASSVRGATELASFHLLLRDEETGNLLAFSLRPNQFASYGNGLQIRAAYPVLEFEQRKE